MADRLVSCVLVAGLLGACSGQSSPTPGQSAQNYLTYAERIERIVACLREQGIDAASYEGFGVRINAAGEEQLERASRAEGECWDTVEEKFPAPPPLTTEEHYHYMVDVARCLRKLGHEVSQPPSLDVYLDQAATQSDMWDPYAEVGSRGEDIYQIQREDCPPAPWAR